MLLWRRSGSRRRVRSHRSRPTGCWSASLRQVVESPRAKPSRAVGADEECARRRELITRRLFAGKDQDPARNGDGIEPGRDPSLDRELRSHLDRLPIRVDDQGVGTRSTVLSRPPEKEQSSIFKRSGTGAQCANGIR